MASKSKATTNIFRVVPNFNKISQINSIFNEIQYSSFKFNAYNEKIFDFEDTGIYVYASSPEEAKNKFIFYFLKLGNKKILKALSSVVDKLKKTTISLLLADSNYGQGEGVLFKSIITLIIDRIFEEFNNSYLAYLFIVYTDFYKLCTEFIKECFFDNFIVEGTINESLIVLESKSAAAIDPTFFNSELSAYMVKQKLIRRFLDSFEVVYNLEAIDATINIYPVEYEKSLQVTPRNTIFID